jgi:hypothetical protein
MDERRRDVRFSTDAQVEMDAPSGRAHGELRNISAGGAFVVTSETPPEDSQVRLVIRVPLELELDARVVQRLPGVGVHLEFDEESTADQQEKLRAFLAKLAQMYLEL